MPYPTTELDSEEPLLKLLGSFWSDLYPGADAVRQLAAGQAELGRSFLDNVDDLIAGISHATAPPLTRQRWLAYALPAAQQQPHLPLYGDPDLLFGGSAVYGTQTDQEPSCWFLPDGLVDVAAISSHVGASEDATLWLRGLDFVVDLDRGLLVFRADPFDAGFRVSNINGDDQATVWLFQPRFDRRRIQDSHGYVAGVDAEVSSARYQQLVSAKLSAWAAGATRQDFVAALVAIADIPLARGAETIEQIVTDRRGVVIVSDQNVYRFVAGATPVVAVGDNVIFGQSLTSGLHCWRLGLDAWPSQSALNSITLPASALLGATNGALEFVNEDTPLIVTTDGDGVTRVEWALGGDSADVQRFWDTTHANGKALGLTLANCLDQRSNKVGQPQASNLPALINPARFLAENVLRGAAVLTQIKADEMGPDALGLDYWPVLEDITPPWVILLRADA